MIISLTDVEPCSCYQGAPETSNPFLKLKNQLAPYAALPYWKSSCTVLFGV